MVPNSIPGIELVFPNIVREGYTPTSPEDPKYNCHAWAMSVNNTRWEPDSDGDWYWPPSIPRTYTQDAFIQAYSSVGYEVCASRDFEQGYEKICIYIDSMGVPSHTARQLNQNEWTSKLGFSYDIRHTLDGLGNGFYGAPTIFMRRGVIE